MPGNESQQGYLFHSYGPSINGLRFEYNYVQGLRKMFCQRPPGARTTRRVSGVQARAPIHQLCTPIRGATSCFFRLEQSRTVRSLANQNYGFPSYPTPPSTSPYIYPLNQVG